MTGGFVQAWGSSDAVLIHEVELFAGGTLPADYRECLVRFANLHVGYTRIMGLGPLNGRPAVLELTEERREEWPALPSDALVLGEDDTDMYVLRCGGNASGVEVRTECSADLAVFQVYSTFALFLREATERAIRDAQEIGQLPAGFNPWRPADGRITMQ